MEFCLVQFVMEIKDAMEGILFDHECKKRNEGFQPKQVMLMWQLEILLIGCGYVIELADERGIIS